MVDPDKFYSSRLLFNQLFKTAEDITISFLYTNPDAEKLGVMRTENLDFLVQEDGTDIEFNINKGVVDGLSVFLLDGTNTPGLSGGANLLPGIGTSKIFSNSDVDTGLPVISAAKITSSPALTIGIPDGVQTQPATLFEVGPPTYDSQGLNLVTDSVLTSLSALSGLLVITALDQTGYFGLCSNGGHFLSASSVGLPPNNGALTQFNSGVSALEPKKIVVRGVDRGATLTNQPTAFPFKGSIDSTSNETITVDKQYRVFSIAFKRHLQDVIIYDRTADGLETRKVIDTGVHLQSLPVSARFGISYSGHMPMEIKNITVNGTIL